MQQMKLLPYSKNVVKHAIINLGGNILVIGSNINGSPWKIGIQDPYDSRNDYMGIVEVVDKSVVTSGIRKIFEADGKDIIIFLILKLDSQRIMA